MASMVHLFTHAMFKALLFLCAGALIHAIGSNDYTAMHGLRKHMPNPNWTFLIGSLPIAGIIHFSGFWSKDVILAACFGYDIVAYIWMSLVAGLTAFYMFRLYFLIFWWKDHETPKGEHDPHDQAWTMTLPLVFLAAVSCVAGFIPFGDLVTWDGKPYDIMHHFDWGIAAISLAIAVVGIGVAWVMYRKENNLPERMRQALPRLWTWCFHRFYWDELYQFVTHKIIFARICRPIAWVDRHVIDGSMDGLAWVTNKASWSIKGLQSGQVHRYAWIYLAGALLLGAITVICLM